MSTRLFLHTRLTARIEAPLLLSLALVGHDSTSLYMELPNDELAAIPEEHLDDLFVERAIEAMGRVEGASVPRSSMAGRLVEWLNDLSAEEVELAYDEGISYDVFAALIREAGTQLRPRLTGLDVKELHRDSAARGAAHSLLRDLRSGGVPLGDYHALSNAFALERMFEVVHEHG